jgi:hypothetical protein
MIYYSHRGNLTGPNSSRENNPQYIQEALKCGYSVEIDVWNINGRWFSGHDHPQYPLTNTWLFNNENNLLFHCKNIEALANSSIKWHYFWHENDKYTITNKDKIVVYPGVNTYYLGNIILMKPEHSVLYGLDYCYGICSDYIQLFNNKGDLGGNTKN